MSLIKPVAFKYKRPLERITKKPAREIKLDLETQKQRLNKLISDFESAIRSNRKEKLLAVLKFLALKGYKPSKANMPLLKQILESLKSRRKFLNSKEPERKRLLRTELEQQKFMSSIIGRDIESKRESNRLRGRLREPVERSNYSIYVEQELAKTRRELAKKSFVDDIPLFILFGIKKIGEKETTKKVFIEKTNFLKDYLFNKLKVQNLSSDERTEIYLDLGERDFEPLETKEVRFRMLKYKTN